MTTKETLMAEIVQARSALVDAEAALIEWQSRAENNVFATIDEAECAIEDALRDEAFQHCEGTGNCGLDSYSRDFMVGDKTYTGTLKVEYNRHDKTYYYIEESEFMVAEKEVA